LKRTALGLSAILCVLSLSAAPVFAQQSDGQPAKPKVDISSPEATVRSFINALNNADDKQAEECVYRANRRNRTHLLKSMELHRKTQYKLTITDILVEKQYERYAFALVNYKAQWIESKTGKNVSYNATDMLKLTGFGPVGNQAWFLLSNDPDLMWGGAPGGELLMAITLIAHPEVLEPPAKCRRHVEQAGYAAMAVTREFDGKLAVAEKAAATPAAPESKVAWSPLKRIFATMGDQPNNYFPIEYLHCPADTANPERESYTFNENLDGIELKKLNEPANLVLLYEGAGGKLHFNHDGRAAVFFADGHSEMLSEEQAKTVRWTP